MNFDDVVDWFFTYLMFPIIFIMGFVGIPLLIYVSIEQLLHPSPTIELIKRDWDCSKTQSYMVGKVIENRCIQYTRLP